MLRAGVIPPGALLVGITCLGVMMALMPANRLLTLLGLRRWRLAALFIPLVGPFVFMWLVAFPGGAAGAPAEAARREPG
ncbi:hypothetical protein [Acidocella sp.]|uniref:hypothetical protein n=1 Tax=Acidocella sp. TaxID=50710 RepID=UPI003D068345